MGSHEFTDASLPHDNTATCEISAVGARFIRTMVCYSKYNIQNRHLCCYFVLYKI